MKIKYILILLCLSFFTCQNEIINVETPAVEDTIQPNTVLTNLMRKTSANNGKADDVLDNSSCFSVNLPVTIIVDDTTIVINTLNDLEQLETILNTTDDNIVEFVFPITIIFSNYTEVVIENEAQLLNFIENCEFENNDNIECINFIYPISFAIYDNSSNILDTVIINNDEELYQFLENLEANNNLIITLEFPVTLIYENGDTVEVNSNEELTQALETAAANCNTEEDECNFETISANLTQCVWVIGDENSSNNNFENYVFQFNTNGSFNLTEEITTSTISGLWNLNNTDTAIVLTLSELTGYEDDLGGDWQIITCSEDTVIIKKGDVTLQLQQFCDNDLDCVDDDLVLVECDEDGDATAIFNLTIPFENCTQLTSITYHINQQDAETGANPIPSPETFSNTVSPQIIYASISVNTIVEVVSLELYVEDCSQNAFECYQSFDAVLELCDENNDGFEVFDLTLAFANCEQDNHNLNYYLTQADAEAETNPLATPNSYTNTSVPEVIYVRVEIENQYQIVLIQLLLEDCNGNTICDEDTVENALLQCLWRPTDYNGSDNLADYNFDFQDNAILVVYNSQSTITTTWYVTQTANGLFIEFTNLAGSDIQALTGQWLIVDCADDTLQLQRDNEVLTLSQYCD